MKTVYIRTIIEKKGPGRKGVTNDYVITNQVLGKEFWPDVMLRHHAESHCWGYTNVTQ